jgi:hypothetical protein
MKKTVVDTLIEELTEHGFKHLGMAEDIIEETKEIEKQQMIDFLKSVFQQDGFNYDKAYQDFIDNQTQILDNDISEYEKNDMDDFVVNGKLSISKLYELAKKEGFEDRTLFFSVKNKTTGQHFSTQTVVDFGKGWSKDTAIMHLIWEELPHTDACQG